MTTAHFHFNTVVICYNCRWQALGSIKFSVHPENRTQGTLGVIFITCNVCARFPHVYNPRCSLQRGYIDVRRYSDLIEKFECVPIVWNEKRFFSIARLGFKTIAQIEDCQTVYRLLIPPKFAILDNGQGSKFFSNEPAYPTKGVTPIFHPQGFDAANPNSVDPPPPYSRQICSEYLRNKELPPLPSCLTSTVSLHDI
jgi:hypothetical protein